MKYCPITYEEIAQVARYSERGLKLLSPKLKELKNLPLTAEQQRQQAVLRAGKMSIQGIQAKVSARLNIEDGVFELTDRNGRYILKPQSDIYSQLPENEDLTMRLAEVIGLDIPLHGLMHCAGGTFTYFIRRFDRTGRGDKLAVEDFAQLAGQTRDTKYDWTMEKILPIIESHLSFPVVGKAKLLKLTLFNFVVGNEDMHLKNFSVISREGKVELSPCYDLINTTLATPNAQEELALPLRGKKRKLTRTDFRDYFGVERMGLREAVFDEALSLIETSIPAWHDLIRRSFLHEPAKEKYRDLIRDRMETLLP